MLKQDEKSSEGDTVAHARPPQARASETPTLTYDQDGMAGALHVAVALGTPRTDRDDAHAVSVSQVAPKAAAPVGVHLNDILKSEAASDPLSLQAAM